MPVDQYIKGVRTCNSSFIVFKIFYEAITYQNKNFNITEPFKSLFTQGMVCHETYKDKYNNWLSPDEVEKINNNVVKKKTIMR